MGEEVVDPRRIEPAFVAGERAMLEAWLEFHRITLLLRCEWLGVSDLRARPVPTSSLSLHGLVRHMGDVERNWFTRVLLRAPDTPPLFSDPNLEDSDLVPLDAADWRPIWRRGRTSATAAGSTQAGSGSTTLGCVTARSVLCGGSTST